MIPLTPLLAQLLASLPRQNARINTCFPARRQSRGILQSPELLTTKLWLRPACQSSPYSVCAVRLRR